MNDDELDSLLAKGALSGPERDRVLDRVLERLPPSTSGARRRWTAGWLGLLAATAGAGVTIAASRRPHGPFSARGGEAAEVPVDVVCTNGALRACPRGSHLVFRSDRNGYLAAYAEPVGGGDRIWYFAANTHAPFVGAASTSDLPVGRAVVIGPEHAIGPYAIHVLVGSRPLSVADALDPSAAGVVASEVVRLDVIQ